MGLLQLKGRKLLIVFRRNTTVGADAKNMLVSIQIDLWFCWDIRLIA